MSITVVVPTMWRWSPFLNFFSHVLNHDRVNRAVLINNNPALTPNHSLLNHPKLKILNFGTNIFVNPAWNAGVMHSGNSLTCIMNDDLIFDTRLFGRILSWYQPSYGCVGLCSDPVSGDIEFEPHTTQPCFGFGQLMFVHHSNWIDIPPELLVYFGDNWIFDTHKKRWGSNYLIRNLLHHTPHAQTSSLEVGRLEQERAIYSRLLTQHRLPNSHG